MPITPRRRAADLWSALRPRNPPNVPMVEVRVEDIKQLRHACVRFLRHDAEQRQAGIGGAPARCRSPPQIAASLVTQIAVLPVPPIAALPDTQ